MIEATVVIVNFKTLDLIERCYTSLRAVYKTVPVILIDNGSGDESTAFIKRQQGEHTRCFLFDKNCGHGKGLHYATEKAKTGHVFTLDSDCEILKGGFLEEMAVYFYDPQLYAVGPLWTVDEGNTPYIHPSSMMFDKRKYIHLQPFTHLGAPLLLNMRSVKGKFKVEDFDVTPYIYHKFGGTRHRYGWDGTGRYHYWQDKLGVKK